jgi:hypothetical protein
LTLKQEGGSNIRYCLLPPEDYANVHALQDKFSLVPLSSYGKAYTPLHAVDNNFDVK